VAPVDGRLVELDPEELAEPTLAGAVFEPPATESLAHQRVRTNQAFADLVDSPKSRFSH
jgi:hypothetical protein